MIPRHNFDQRVLRAYDSTYTESKQVTWTSFLSTHLWHCVALRVVIESVGVYVPPHVCSSIGAFHHKESRQDIKLGKPQDPQPWTCSTTDPLTRFALFGYPRPTLCLVDDGSVEDYREGNSSVFSLDYLESRTSTELQPILH
jgi:hypothetical protein